ncbi:unnamed protein product, partial [marine sediment metagenome]
PIELEELEYDELEEDDSSTDKLLLELISSSSPYIIKESLPEL